MRLFGPRDDDDAVRAARLKAARSNPLWTELEAVDLVPREPAGMLIAAETDRIY